VKILSLVISGFVFLLGVFYGRNIAPSKPPEQLGAQTDKVATPSASVTEQPSGAPTAKPTTKVVPTNSPQPTQASESQPSSSLNDFKYPGSSVTSQSDSSMTLTSNDDATTITNWYSTKLKSAGFNSLSTASSKADDKFRGQVVGGKSGEQISVTIEKDTSSQAVSISVSKSNNSSSNSSIHIENHN
jgi:hypothetical protein